MKIDKFKLIAGGIEGIEVWRTEPVKKGNIVTLDQVHRIRRIQIDKSLREDIQGLKYFLLQLTRHWIPPFNNYFDTEKMAPLPFPDGEVKGPHKILKSLWNDTLVTGVSVKADGFVITGTIESVPDKKMGISTPFITSEDDIGFYFDAIEKIEHVADQINKYLYSRLLPIEEAREQYMLENKQTSMSEQEENELIEKLIEKFQQEGAIILMSDQHDIEALEAPNIDGDVTVHQSRTVINREAIPEAEEEPMMEMEEQIIIQDNVGHVPSSTIVGGDDPLLERDM